jgi:hypothetical protein
MDRTPRPAAPRHEADWTPGEIAALLAPVFGVTADGLCYIVLIQTPNGRSDATTNIVPGDCRAFLQEALGMMPGGQA